MLVSVIMPYFRKRRFIDKSINSILNQSYANYEIIIIYDDENLDDFFYLKKIKKKNDRITLLKNDVNKGAGYSRNLGIENSKGDFVAFLDCDDVWKNNKLEYQINFMKKNNVDISFTAYDIINHQDEVIGERTAKKILNFKDLIKSCDIGLSTVIIKRCLLTEDYKFASLKTKEDYILWLKLAKNDNNFYGIDQKLSQWRKLDNSLSSNSFQKISDAYRVYNKYMNYSKIFSVICLLRLSFNYFLKK